MVQINRTFLSKALFDCSSGSFSIALKVYNRRILTPRVFLLGVITTSNVSFYVYWHLHMMFQKALKSFMVIRGDEYYNWLSSISHMVQVFVANKW